MAIARRFVLTNASRAKRVLCNRKIRRYDDKSFRSTTDKDVSVPQQSVSMTDEVIQLHPDYLYYRLEESILY